jgi:haloacetate dehalogenase
VLDIVPTSNALARADEAGAQLLALVAARTASAPSGTSRRRQPRGGRRHALGQWGSDATAFPSDVRNAYVDALRDPAVVHTICEEYRAAITVDRTHDLDRRAGRLIECATRVLWSEGGSLDTWYEGDGGPPSLWRAWSRSVTGRALPGGHFFPEANAPATLAEQDAFFDAA